MKIVLIHLRNPPYISKVAFTLVFLKIFMYAIQFSINLWVVPVFQQMKMIYLLSYILSLSWYIKNQYFNLKQRRKYMTNSLFVCFLKKQQRWKGNKVGKEKEMVHGSSKWKLQGLRERGLQKDVCSSHSYVSNLSIIFVWFMLLSYQFQKLWAYFLSTFIWLTY